MIQIIICCIGLFLNTFFCLTFAEEDGCSSSPPMSPRSPPMSPRLMRKTSIKMTARHTISFKKSANGLGFSLESIRVYIGDSDYFIVHHLIKVCVI